MRINLLHSAEAERNLDESVTALRKRTPDLSAHEIVSPRQRSVILLIVFLVLVGSLIDVIDTFVAVVSIITALYIAITVNRAVLFVRSRRAETMERVTDEEARSVADDDLPVYTVLVPAYHEPEVIGTLLRNLERLEYPRTKLDVKLILESDDTPTIEAAEAAEPGDHVELVLVPPAGPRTKPKALNYALPFARGELITIYDAEDEPEPLQLRRAVVALNRSDERTVCLQAHLSFGNVRQNLLTKWFTLEYQMWFASLLPGLVSLGAPLPLGGTSNHFKTAALKSLGAWDPYNVTEDADLGIRLAREGYRCAVLESVTYEEANSDLVNWVKQRSRWYKGYLQTGLIHLRDPIRTYRELGWKGFLQFVLFMIGTPLLAVLNPIFWSLTLLWFVTAASFIRTLYPSGLYYPALACWIFGNLLVGYLTILTCRVSRRYELITSAVLVPIYWVLMATAAIKALWQLLSTPTFWEKTTHGLARSDSRSDAHGAVPPPAGAGA